jgi:hypothetical protein
MVIPMHTWETDPKEFKEKVEVDSYVKATVLKLNEELKIN